MSKEGIRISVKGDLGNGSTLRKQNTSADDEAAHTVIEIEEATELTFALRYLNNIAKATPLSGQVRGERSQPASQPAGLLGDLREGTLRPPPPSSARHDAAPLRIAHVLCVRAWLQVCLSMSKDVPLMVEYRMAELGSMRFYLAPKIEDEVA